ncbi:MAG TPA: 3-deoxy-D-manno-octulosonic acid transferase [Phenylobacterium sp.]|uniref:3-deoxy-D-manno-octulosonic acid transferase n=1 Tax=Phenylobacterium sp. TaxID=1871053 RepID=UPI002D3967E4|nr:3-deoxy-D-manno-octulosonic acid transferase [Phenylobacterium sp.]HZZ70160.1 3-deoxy-D-manno-octulosonic acid transferase [Phenylobacterium sp.]
MSAVRRTLPLALYAAATGLLEPLAPALLARRAGAGKEDPARLSERLGRPAMARPEGPLAWLHGVSVGESLSLLPLIAALQAARPDLNLLVTSGTVTSAAVLARRLPPGVIHQFAPVDAPGAAARFLNHWRPGAALFVESELWPNLIVAAKRREVKLALLSARMTQGSAQGWARAPATARSLLQAFDLILPQDAETETRLKRLDADVGPHLNLKLVGDAPPVDGNLVMELDVGLGNRAAVLAASTHPGEELLIAEAFRAAAAQGPPAMLIVAPRHPDRGPGVAADLAARGFAVARRGAGEALTAKTTAYVADTLGELGAFYAAADAVVMGGSFVEGIGGHNPLEAARLGCAIVTGPHVFNAREIYAEMLADTAAIEAFDAAALGRHLRGLLANPVIARRIGEAAQDYAGRQGAALTAAMALIEPLLPA